MPQNSVPWGAPGDTNPDLYQYEDRYRGGSRAWGNGIVNDRGGLPIQMTCTGTDQVLHVSTGELFFNGTHVIVPATSFTLSDYGTSPTTGQARIDALVARYDPDAQDVLLVLKPGTPAAGTVTSGPVAPPVTVDPDGVEELLLGTVARAGGASLQQVNIVPVGRVWTGGVTSGAVAPRTDLPAGALHVAVTGPWANLTVHTADPATGAVTPRAVNNPSWLSTPGSGTFTYLAGVTGNLAVRAVGGRLELAGTLTRSSGADWTIGDLAAVQLSAALVSGLTATTYGQAAANTVAGARVRVSPQSGGTALLYIAAVTGTKLIILDALTLAIR